MNNDELIMDADEIMLLDCYEKEFGITPPIAFLDPELSKKLMKQSLRSKMPFSEKDLDSMLDD